MISASTHRVAMAAGLLWFGMATGALAHGFGNDIPLIIQIKIGAKLILASTNTMLVLIVTGLVLSYGGLGGLKQRTAAFIAGIVVGFPLAFVLQIDMVWAALVLVIVLGGMVTLNRFAPKRVMWLLFIGTGACLVPLGFIGHELAGMPPLILGNYLFTAFLVTSGALICGLAAQRFVHIAWVPIVLRIAGSWISAIAILVGAFFIGMPG